MGRVTVGYQDGCLHPLWITKAGVTVSRLLGADALDERLELRPPGQRHAAVAAGGAGSADVGLEQHDVGARVAAAQLERRPEAGEAAADDADLGVDLARERLRVVRRLAVERLRHPVAAAGVRGRWVEPHHRGGSGRPSHPS